jgi:hypothetical protein
VATAQGASARVATLFTLPVWPRSDSRCRGVSTSHTRAFWSPLAVMSVRSPSHHATSKMALLCASHCEAGT